MWKNVVLVLLIVALLGSMALNVFFFRYGQQRYLILSAVQLDPIGLSWYGSEDVPEPPAPGARRVVIFGDSRAYSWPAVASDAFQSINRGIGNETSEQALLRFEAHVELLEPDVVIIQVGVNDLKAIPLFPERRESIVANCKANIAAIVDKAVGLDAQIIVTTIFPLGRVPLERRLFWSNDVAESINEVNAYLFSLAGPKVVVFDTTPVLANEQGIVQKAYSQDLLHLTPAGYDAPNEALLAVLGNPYDEAP